MTVPSQCDRCVRRRRARGWARSLRFRGVWRGGEREGEGEGGASAGTAGEGDGAAVGLDDLAGAVEAEAQTDAGAVLVLGAGDAIEAIPEGGLLVGRDAETAVTHGDAGSAGFACEGDGDGLLAA